MDSAGASRKGKAVSTKPRYRFCWSCLRQLWGRRHRTVRLTDREAELVHVHADCARAMINAGEAEMVAAPRAMVGDGPAVVA